VGLDGKRSGGMGKEGFGLAEVTYVGLRMEGCSVFCVGGCSCGDFSVFYAPPQLLLGCTMIT